MKSIMRFYLLYQSMRYRNALILHYFLIFKKCYLPFNIKLIDANGCAEFMKCQNNKFVNSIFRII